MEGSGSLTPKQEAFALAYIETGNASEAYRRAYNVTSDNQATINRTAKGLVDNPKIAARIAELQAAHLQRHNLTVDDIARMLNEDRAFARECEKPSACVSASMGLAKLYGYLGDKLEIGVTDELAAIIADRRRRISIDASGE